VQDDPASADEAEVGGSYASLPLGDMDERGGGGGRPALPRAKHPPNPRTSPNGPVPTPMHRSAWKDHSRNFAKKYLHLAHCSDTCGFPLL